MRSSYVLKKIAFGETFNSRQHSRKSRIISALKFSSMAFWLSEADFTGLPGKRKARVSLDLRVSIEIRSSLTAAMVYTADFARIRYKLE